MVKIGKIIKNNKLMSLLRNDDKLLQQYKTIWTNIEDLENIEWNALPVYNNKYIKTKQRKYGDSVCTNFRSLNMLEDGLEFKYFTTISIDSLLVCENRYFLQVYLDDCAYKIVNTQIKNYLDGNLFKSD